MASVCLLSLLLRASFLSSFCLTAKNSVRNHAPMKAASTEEYSLPPIAWTPSVKSGARDAAFGPLKQYCPSTSEVIRRKTRTVTAGQVKFGSDHRIVRQTMATTSTADVEASVEQIIR